MGSQHYVDEANKRLTQARTNRASGHDITYDIAAAQVNATLAVAGSIHDLISHLRGVTPCRPFDTEAKP